jgi:hypothetical protein
MYLVEMMKTTTNYEIAYVLGRNSAKRLPNTSQKYCGFSQLAPCPVTVMASQTLGGEEFFMGRIPKLKT